MSEEAGGILTFEQFMAVNPRQDLEWKNPQESWRGYTLFRTGFEAVEMEMGDVIALAVKRGAGQDYPDTHYVFSAASQTLHRIPFDPDRDLVSWVPLEGAPGASF